MNNNLSEFQDLTLDFLGSQEYLVLVPKPNKLGLRSSPAIQAKMPPGSAIIAKKITNSHQIQSDIGTRDETNGDQPNALSENLDSQTYGVYFGEYNTGDNTSQAFFQSLNDALEKEQNVFLPSRRLLVSKKNINEIFSVVGILNTSKLKELRLTPVKLKVELVGDYIDIFPEYRDVLLDWVRPK